MMEALDPGASGKIAWEQFRDVVGGLVAERGVDEGEAAEAWALFVAAGGGGERITLEGLRRVAGGLRVEVGDQLLRDMIEEANGLGPGGVGRGVGRGEFEAVLRRAGALG